jgi:hypothetical protein
MAWWGWLLLAWALVAVLVALGMGAAARTIKREEQAASAVRPPEVPVEPLPGPGGEPAAAPRRTRLSAGLRAGPRR